MRERVSRGSGKSSLGAVAYLCRAQFRDGRLGQIFDWRQPSGSGISAASAYIERAHGDHPSRHRRSLEGTVVAARGRVTIAAAEKDIGLMAFPKITLAL